MRAAINDKHFWKGMRKNGKGRNTENSSQISTREKQIAFKNLKIVKCQLLTRF